MGGSERERTGRIEREKAGEPFRDFVSLAAHDLRQPIRSLRAFGDLLEAEAGPSLSPTARRHLRRMREGAERLRELVDAFERFVRIPDLARRVPVDLEEAVRGAVGALDADLREAEVEVEWADLPTASGDPALLGVLLQNLVANAIRHRGAHHAHVHISCEPGHDDWVVSVRDEGPGIPPEDAERIFDPLTSLDRRAGGSGMGLTIARRIVEAHDGEIWVESTPGAGATFRFTLPR